MAGSAYLTPDEYVGSPGAVDVTSLLTGGKYADQASALTEMIGRASDWMSETVCLQSLVASRRTEQITVRRPYGTRPLVLEPKAWKVPLVLEELWVGSNAADQEQVDISGWWTENYLFKIPASSISWRSTGPALARPVYLAGFPNTTVADDVAAASSTLTVDDTAGIAGGTALSIVDGEGSERVTVASVAGNELTLTAPLAAAHPQGVAIHDMPGNVKQAAVLAVSGLIKGKGSGGIVMTQLTQATPPQGEDPAMYHHLSRAMNILKPYRRTW